MKRMTKRSHSPSPTRAGLAALTAALLVLAGCSGTGSLASDAGAGGVASGADAIEGNGNGGGTGGGGHAGGGGGGGGGGGTGPGDTPVADATSPLGLVVREQGQSVSTLGQTVGALADPAQNLLSPLVGASSAEASAGVVRKAGDTVGAIGSALSDGLGQPGAGGNPLGTTAAGLGAAVDQAGQTVGGVGGVVSGLSENTALAPLSPVTGTAGQLVDKAGELVSRVGQRLESAVSSGPADRLLQGGSEVLANTSGGLIGATQAVGTASGLGPVVQQLSDPLAGTLGNAAGQLSSRQNPLASGLGEVVATPPRPWA